MNFEFYPNIAVLEKDLGGSKQTALNKKNYAKAEEGWNKLSSEELAYINQAATTAVKVMNSYVTPGYILHMAGKVFYVIPVRDLVWMYTTTVTQRMYFIPYNKMHSLNVVDRTGEIYTLGTMNTGGFSKKTPATDAMQRITDIILPQRPGMILGWSEEISKAVSENFVGVVQSVDARCAGVQ